MKRFNLLLTKHQNNLLIINSKASGKSKAAFVRGLIQQCLNNPKFSIYNKPYSTKGNFKDNFAFNFQICEEENNWLEKVSNDNTCTKGDIVRWLIAYNQTLNVHKKDDSSKLENPIVNNINMLLVNHKYDQLSIYINKQEISTLLESGSPEILLKAIDYISAELNSFKFNLLKAKLYWFIGDSTSALSILEELTTINVINKQEHVQVNTLKADILIDIGKPLVAESILKYTENKYSAGCNSTFYNKLGLSTFYTDNLESVKSKYQLALEKSSNNTELAIAHRYLGSISYTLGKFEEAENHFSKSLLLFNNKNCNKDEYTRLLITYAEFEAANTNWNKARKYAQESVEIAREINHQKLKAWSKRILSEIYFNIQDESKAVETIDKSIAISKSIGAFTGLSRGYIAKAKYLILLKRFTEANALLSAAKKLEKKVTEDSIYNYDSVTHWETLLNFFEKGVSNYSLLHKHSNLLRIKNHSLDENSNDYILGYMYLSSNDNNNQSRGNQIIKRLHHFSMEAGNKKLQFATESLLRFNKFLLP